MKEVRFPGGQGGYEHWKGLPHRFGTMGILPNMVRPVCDFWFQDWIFPVLRWNLQLDHHVPLETPKKIGLITLLDVRYMYDSFKTKYSVQDGPVLVINGVAIPFAVLGQSAHPPSQHNMKQLWELNDITNSLFKQRPGKDSFLCFKRMQLWWISFEYCNTCTYLKQLETLSTIKTIQLQKAHLVLSFGTGHGLQKGVMGSYFPVNISTTAVVDCSPRVEKSWTTTSPWLLAINKIAHIFAERNGPRGMASQGTRVCLTPPRLEVYCYCWVTGWEIGKIWWLASLFRQLTSLNMVVQSCSVKESPFHMTLVELGSQLVPEFQMQITTREQQTCLNLRDKAGNKDQ